MKFKIIKAKKIYIGKNLDLIENGAIVIKGNKIHEILQKEELSQLENIQGELFDLKDLTIFPGLIDCHSHLNIDASLTEHLELLAWSNECELTLIALNALKKNIESGITTIRCLGDKYYTDVTLKDKVNKKEIVGPDVLSAGFGIKGSHGSGYIGYPHCGKEEIRKTVRNNLKQRVDTLKLFVTPGQLSEKNNLIPSYLSLEEITVAVEEGNRLGIPVAAHCIGGKGLEDCIKAGVKVIEHMYGANDKDIELLKNSNCYVDLTPGIFLDSEREKFLSEENVKSIHRNREKVKKSMEKIIENNIPFTLGTDAYHGELYKEVIFAVELGADLKEALKAVTSTAAKICQKDDSIGSLEKNYIANLIAIDGDPLIDPQSLSRVKFVMKQGDIYKNIV